MEIEGTHDFIAISIGKFDGRLVSFCIVDQEIQSTQFFNTGIFGVRVKGQSKSIEPTFYSVPLL